MPQRFVICANCQRIRSQADMRGQRCVYCLPRLGSAPLPAGFRVKPMSEPEDAVERYLSAQRRQRAER